MIKDTLDYVAGTKWIKDNLDYVAGTKWIKDTLDYVPFCSPDQVCKGPLD